PASTIPGPPGATGPVGPTGATGPQGPNWQVGPGLNLNTGTTPNTIDVATPYLPLTGGTIVPFAGFTHPLNITAAQLTGSQSGVPGAGDFHPAMNQWAFGSAAQPDDMSGITSTMFYQQIEYYAGGPNMTGTRGGLRIHGALSVLSPNSPSNTVGIGHLQEIT